MAERSTEAAREISKLIEMSASNVQEGSDMVAETEQSLSRISEAVTGIEEQVSSIATACAEQATTMGEIDNSVCAIDKDTQSNSAMIEETLAATQIMGQQVKKLSNAMGRFDVPQEQQLTGSDLPLSEVKSA